MDPVLMILNAAMNHDREQRFEKTMSIVGLMFKESVEKASNGINYLNVAHRKTGWTLEGMNRNSPELLDEIGALLQRVYDLGWLVYIWKHSRAPHCDPEWGRMVHYLGPVAGQAPKVLPNEQFHPSASPTP